jgi:uncharacterized membrane protein
LTSRRAGCREARRPTRAARRTTSTGSEGGAAALTIPVATVLVVVASLALGDLGAVMVARARVQTAADAAALAAAVELALGWPAPVEQARRLATANGARLVSCRCPAARGGTEGTAQPAAEVRRDAGTPEATSAPDRAWAGSSASSARMVLVEVDAPVRIRLLPHPLHPTAQARADVRAPVFELDRGRLHDPQQ